MPRQMVRPFARMHRSIESEKLSTTKNVHQYAQFRMQLRKNISMPVSVVYIALYRRLATKHLK